MKKNFIDCCVYINTSIQIFCKKKKKKNNIETFIKNPEVSGEILPLTMAFEKFEKIVSINIGNHC